MQIKKLQVRDGPDKIPAHMYPYSLLSPRTTVYYPDWFTINGSENVNRWGGNIDLSRLLDETGYKKSANYFVFIKENASYKLQYYKKTLYKC